MRNIKRSTSAICPTADAMGYLQQFLAANRGVVRLDVPFKTLGLPTGLGLGLDVALNYEVVAESTRVSSIPVSWRAHNGGPYPTFSGVLQIESDGDVRCRLTLGGEYEAPLGTVGAAFDIIAGKRIAEASLETLLRTLSEEVERRALARGVEAAYS